MKKIFLVLFLIFTIFLTSCTKQEEKKVKKYYNTAYVQTWTVNNWESYIWYAHGINEVMLSTQSSWKIVNLKYKLWDKVKTWELIASLDSLDGKVAYNTAVNVIWSIDSLKSFTELSYDEQVNILTKKIEEINTSSKLVDKTTINLENLKNTELDSSSLLVKQAETQLETTKNDLEQSLNVYEWKKQDLYKSWKNVITNSVILDTNIINFSDELLWVTEANKDKNNSFQDFLWAKNVWILNQSKELFTETNLLYKDYKNFYETTIENKTPSNENILLWLEKWLKVAEKIKEMLNSIYKTVDNSIVSVSLSSTDLQNYREKVSNFWSQIEQNILSINWNFSYGLRWTKESLDSIERDFNRQKTLLQKNIDLASDNLNTIKQWQNKINASSTISTDNEQSKKEIYQKQVEWILAQIESIKAEKNSKIKEIDSNITKIQWDKNLASVMIQNWNIVSPIDWIILEKMAEEWQITSPWNPIYMVWDDSKIKVNIEVLPDNLSKFSLWTKVDIGFEGLSKTFVWIVTNIASSNDIQTKKTNIEIIVDNKDKEIKIWTIAKVYVKNNIQKNDWIVIPNNSIIQKFSIPWVYMLTDNKAIFTKIEIVNQNSSFTEIKWLKIWDKIITDGKENIYDWEILE